MANETTDIIGIVREDLQIMAAGEIEDNESLKLEYKDRAAAHYQEVAQALLDRDEKVRIAADALKEVETARSSGDGLRLDAAIAKALSRIRSLPL